MKITKLEPVTRTYCDECGDDITWAAQYGRSFQDGGLGVLCSDCLITIRNNMLMARRLEHALTTIREQPFFVGRKR